MAEKESQESNDSNEVILGNKLRLLRESRGYSIEDVSGQLYLDCSLIRALESGDYSDIPSETYAKGYIRNFIKLFDAMSEFKSFNLFENKRGAVSIIPNSITYKNPYIFKRIKRNNFLSLIFIFVILSGVYFVEIEYSLIDRVVTIFAKSEFRQDNISLKEESKSIHELATSVVSHVATRKPRLSNSDSINMYFKHDSWAQIEDATGTKLLSRFVKSGNILNLKGKLPFTIVLGNSRAVKIRVNGNVFNQSKYNEKEIAHFVINNNNLNKR